MDKSVTTSETEETLHSPEKLNDYIKVSNPGVWLVLGSIAALLVGVLVWSVVYELPEGIRPIQFLFP
jgi:hypothetical protein